MTILSHRGIWETREQQNTCAAFERSFDLGFGTETDFRDRAGQLAIAHDPDPGPALSAERFFALLASYDHRLPLAINIKADGLQSLLKTHLDRNQIENYFLFDMSVPDAVRSMQEGLNCFTRHSDIEPLPAFYEQARGVWMDAFFNDWITPSAISRHLDADKRVCLVSPELHRRPHFNFWTMLESSGLSNHPDLMLCTDLPQQASNHFSITR